MARNAILDLPLSEVMRPEIALPLQHLMNLYTVGHLLNAWRRPRNHSAIERLFDNPAQARHAIAVCAAWLGVNTHASVETVSAWWNNDGALANAATTTLNA